MAAITEQSSWGPDFEGSFNYLTGERSPYEIETDKIIGEAKEKFNLLSKMLVKDFSIEDVHFLMDPLKPHNLWTRQAAQKIIEIYAKVKGEV